MGPFVLSTCPDVAWLADCWLFQSVQLLEITVPFILGSLPRTKPGTGCPPSTSQALWRQSAPPRATYPEPTPPTHSLVQRAEPPTPYVPPTKYYLSTCSSNGARGGFSGYLWDHQSQASLRKRNPLETRRISDRPSCKQNCLLLQPLTTANNCRILTLRQTFNKENSSTDVPPSANIFGYWNLGDLMAVWLFYLLSG